MIFMRFRGPPALMDTNVSQALAKLLSVKRAVELDKALKGAARNPTLHNGLIRHRRSLPVYFFVFNSSVLQRTRARPGQHANCVSLLPERE
jgi:hypothetical protein